MYNTLYPKANIDEYKIKTENITLILQKNDCQPYNESADYLINTPGCFIPNYLKTFKLKEARPIKKTCGERAVFIKKISNDIIKFKINQHKMTNYNKGEKYTCCYKFARPSIVLGKIDNTALRYSPCEYFTNDTEAPLEHEVIVVTCFLIRTKNKVIYEDAYAIIKKIKVINQDEKEKSWNILILGMDTMSRARIYKSMPKTAAYLSQNNWLDYRGYQKVGYNTFPNVMALLTGKEVSTVYKACSSGMDSCNELVIWSAFKKAGYVTGTGEEYLQLPDTFAKRGYKNSPTDHYLRPLFLTGENRIGSLVCTKKVSSGRHILDYASQFANEYKTDKFFGMYWFNSYSHNLENIPALIDGDIVDFFKSLNDTGILNNTFIFFLSDHGIRYGTQRIPYESYYEERLPMLFVWVPQTYKDIYFKEYNNMVLNQNRLVTPYDVRLTLGDIMVSSTNTIPKINTEACSKCVSIFNEIPPERSCKDVNVEDKWCTCHKLESISENDLDTHRSLQLSVSYLQDKMKNIPTISCMECIVLKLKKVLRAHTYRDESSNSTYFVLAFVLTPGDVGYEATIVKRNNEFIIMQPTYTISSYNARGSCVIEPNHRSYCICKKKANCKSKH
ncbi:unnamed protein product, partial [Brenthis ino]